MEKLVLHQAGEPAEFRHVFAQKIQLMHAAQHSPHDAGMIENFHKRLVHTLVCAKLAIHQIHRLPNQLRQIRMQPQTVALHQQKNAHELAGLIAKHTAAYAIDCAVLNPESINHLLLMHAHPAPQRRLPRGPRRNGQPLLNGPHD